MRAYYNEVLLLNWFVTEAVKRGNQYLLMRSVADLVLFGGRFVLAHNRILYPFHKWFMRVLEDAPEKPANFMEVTNAVLNNPNVQTARAFTDMIIEFGGLGRGTFTKPAFTSWKNANGTGAGEKHRSTTGRIEPF
jgi:hypothetical protein